MKGKYKIATTYCNCDMAMVSVGKKCKVCGKRFEPNNKIGKLNTAQIIAKDKEENGDYLSEN